MPNFAETMRLKGLAEEDIYFARRDQELMAALREKRAGRKSVPDTAALKQAVGDAAVSRKATV